MENNDSVCFTAVIEQINPIEGADKIVQAIIGGWECVIQKDMYNIGDCVVIATTDAVIPTDIAEKLNVTNYLKNRKRTNQLTVKTTKLRGVYSSALIVSNLNKGSKAGVDMMDTFGIYKYEEPAVIVQGANGKKIKYHNNSNFHIYYKFPNAKNVPNMFTSTDVVNITTKIHGTNARYGFLKKDRLTFVDKLKKFFGNKWIDYDYVYGSHQVEKGSSSQGFYSIDVWQTIGQKYNIKNKLKQFAANVGRENIGTGIILYGEIYGAGIQKYYDYGLKNIDAVFFDCKFNNEYLSTAQCEELLYSLELPAVEKLYEGAFDMDVITKLQNNRYITGTKIPHEGIVVKCVTGNRVKIAKYINPAYLEFQSKKEDSTDFH